MRVFKFVRSLSYDICLGEFDASSKQIEHSYDVVECEELTLLHTFLYIDNNWIESEIHTVYSIIELLGSTIFKKGIPTRYPTSGKGFVALKSKEAKYFERYKEYFIYQLKFLKEQNNS